MLRKTLLSTALLLAMASAHASTVAQWNFNSTPSDSNSATGTTTPAIGSGTASLVGGTTATFASGDANGGSSDPVTGSPTNDSGWNLTKFATQGTANKTSGAEFKVSTVGFTGVSISYDLRHTNTSSKVEQVQYSINGLTFNDIASFNVVYAGSGASEQWFTRSVDLSSIIGVANNANFAFRVVSAFDGTSNNYAATNTANTYSPTAGTWRFDMVTVNALPVPEPASYALMLAGLALVGAVTRRRRV